MNKIIIIGCPGSGKSYFARQLNKITNIPLYYLDCIFWKENWNHITDDELKQEILNISSNDKWIIDGNYLKSLELRFILADTIFFLDIDEKICLESEEKRRGQKREDLPNFLKEKYDPEFIEYIKAFKTTQRTFIYQLIDKYKDTKEIHIFKTREEKNIYLDTIK